jgi:hypothetical protein
MFRNFVILIEMSDDLRPETVVPEKDIPDPHDQDLFLTKFWDLFHLELKTPASVFKDTRLLEKTGGLFLSRPPVNL